MEDKRLITASEALTLLEEVIKQSTVFQDFSAPLSTASSTARPQAFGLVQHSTDTARIARRVAEAIVRNYNVSLDSDELEIAGALHDIGRPLAKRQLLHELRSAYFIEQSLGQYNISNDQTVLFRLAQMVRTHGLAPEQVFVFKDVLDQMISNAEVAHINLVLCLPHTLNEMIIAYADLTNFSGQEVSIASRLDEVESRSREINNADVLKVIEQSRPRLIAIGDTINAMVSGAMPREEILRYGVI